MTDFNQVKGYIISYNSELPQNTLLEKKFNINTHNNWPPKRQFRLSGNSSSEETWKSNMAASDASLLNTY